MFVSCEPLHLILLGWKVSNNFFLSQAFYKSKMRFQLLTEVRVASSPARASMPGRFFHSTLNGSFCVYTGMPESLVYCSLHDPVSPGPSGYVTNKVRSQPGPRDPQMLHDSFTPSVCGVDLTECDDLED